MRKLKLVYLIFAILILFSTVSFAAEENFSTSTLDAKDINCRKCHTNSPHIIHATKPVECVNCHGDKLSVAIPQCTKCHNGPIHKVHAGKVNTQSCSYCHKTIKEVHNNLLKDAVCSHCHKDLIQVHGDNQACVKCHKSAPNLVKPLMVPGATLICQTCHNKPSVATIHGEPADKQGCYRCHKGTMKTGSAEVPHVIHASKVECKKCHEDNGKIVVPQCQRCHKTEELHAFNKIGRLTPDKGMKCSRCHLGESKLSAASPEPAVTTMAPTPVKTEPPAIEAKIDTVTDPVTGESPEKTPLQEVASGENKPATITGFGYISGIVAVSLTYMVLRRVGKV